MIFAAYPVVVRIGNADFVRSIQKMNPDGSLTFYCAIDEGIVFKVAKGAPGSAEGETQTQRFVFRVTEVIDPPLDANSPQAKQLSTSLQSSYSDDMIGQYIARLESDYGVSINQQALNQVIGGGTANR